MSYAQSTYKITHQHEWAKSFDTVAAAERAAEDLNTGRPENCKPFRVERCENCSQIHVRRGKNVYVITEKANAHHG